MTIENQACKVCCAATLEEFPEFRSLPRVTSDCVAFPAGGRLLICTCCGATQSPADAQWLQEIHQIYGGYRAYHQSGGVEQHVLDPASCQLRQRSDVLLDHLLALPGVPVSGRVLDVGCGMGGTLSAFVKRGEWRLFGLEMDRRVQESLATILGFEALYTGAPADLPGEFDLITMIHSLEHFPEPLTTLQELRTKIALDGRLFVQVPDANTNPFDYVIADHMLHFTPDSLARLSAIAGFAIDCLATTWVTKELSMTAQPTGRFIAQPNQGCDAEIRRVRAQLTWLLRMIEASRSASTDSDNFGLFGTSIAATWLCGVLDDAVSFFVEEDPSRVGRLYMGRPVLRPDQAPSKSVVFLALVPEVALRVAERLRATTLDLRLPPE